MATATPTLLTQGANTAASVYTSASVTPAANSLLLVYVSGGVTGAVEPTGVTGFGLTFEMVASDTTGTGNVNGSLWRAMGPAPSVGAVTITFGAATTNCAWKVIQVTNVNISGTNGSGAIKQVLTFSGASTVPQVSLPNTITSGNISMGFISYNAGLPTNTITAGVAGSGYTKIGSDQNPGGNVANQVSAEYQSPGNRVIDFATTNSAGKVIVGIEIASGVPSTLTVNAGADQSNVEPYTTVVVPGTATGGSGTYTYQWSRVTGPSVTLLNPKTATTSFVAPALAAGGILTLRLSVNDGNSTVTDDVVITIYPWDSFVKVNGVMVPFRRWRRHNNAWV